MLKNVKVEEIRPNAWNPNVVDPINMEKLQRSMEEHGQQMPIIVREVEGEIEIVDGEHRFHAAINMGKESLLAINLGEVSVEEAKRKTIIANTRYGVDDNQKLFDILSSEGVFDSAEQILNTLPIDETELSSLFGGTDIDFDDLEDELEKENDSEIDLGLDSSSSGPDTRIVRFKLSNEDADYLSEIVEKTRAEQGYTGEDALTNAGDALVHIIRGNKDD